MKSFEFFKPTLATASGRLALLLATAVSLIGYPNPATAATFDVGVGFSHPPIGYFPPSFNPSSVTIHPGDQVKWTWVSSGHSTTSGSPGMPNGIWDSGIRSQGATFTHTFNSVGTFPYYCTVHGETGQVIVTPIPPPVADFNNDGKPDFVLFNASTRQTVVWYMNDNVLIGKAVGPTLLVGWQVVGVADFNRDGHPDYLLFNSITHQTAISYLSGATNIANASGPTLPSAWTPVATADFNNDGKPDYLLFNPSTRQTYLWYLNNNVLTSKAAGPVLPPGWSPVAP